MRSVSKKYSIKISIFSVYYIDINPTISFWEHNLFDSFSDERREKASNKKVLPSEHPRVKRRNPLAYLWLTWSITLAKSSKCLFLFLPMVYGKRKRIDACRLRNISAKINPTEIFTILLGYNLILLFFKFRI